MTHWTISSISELIRSRRVSPTELVKELLKKISKSCVNAFITVCEEEALSSARQSESALSRGDIPGRLHGVPFAFKDLFYIEGLPTSCGTAIDAYFAAERTATAVARLQAAGAITLGKLNLTELAMSPFGENAKRGAVANPWSAAASAGGSSSGSAAAVAAGLVLGSLGTDTAGSIRQPAAYCGIVGVKPTYGRISRAGVMPLAWSLDHVGPITKTVRDAGIVLSVVAGYDPFDRSTSTVPPKDYVALLDRYLPKFRLGIPKDYFWERIDGEIESAVRGAADAFARLGAELSDIELGDLNAVNAVASLITRSEGCAVHDRFAQEHPGVLAPAIVERLRLGHEISAYDYLQAQRLRNLMSREFISRVFSEVDLIIAPVAPSAAPPLCELIEGETDQLLDRMGRLTSLTRPFNGLGLPAISVPCGFSSGRLPLAFQLVGRPFGEGLLLQVANRYEQAFDWWKRCPP